MSFFRKIKMFYCGHAILLLAKFTLILFKDFFLHISESLSSLRNNTPGVVFIPVYGDEENLAMYDGML